MRMQTAPPSMVREYRRQASRTSVNPAAATVPVCPNSNGQLYEDDFGALYIVRDLDGALMKPPELRRRLKCDASPHSVVPELNLSTLLNVSKRS
ncbi:hypothetical protein D0866_11579 [Hortaea werneckii]|uniref:Uncharacterized protein n=1 Tax=Hortaea werneckii TaxID=91943 RepID=A0A3M7A8N3_HORWE|nr:hypothetical protein D0866_11579 [Hortaea werneckii]